MSFCNEHGIPHSEFLEWSAEDRAKQLAYLLEQGERCTMCGTAGWEWEKDRFAYTPVEHYCPGCYQKHVMGESTQNSLPGTTIKLVPTTPMLKASMLVKEKKRALRDREE